MICTTSSTEETRAAGANIAAKASAGDIYALIGELGAGKTEFVRGFVAYFDKDAPVSSPSFTLLNIYKTPAFPVYHFDFYRVAHAEELSEIGFSEYLWGDGVCLIEWADRYIDLLPKQGVTTIKFSDNGNNRRTIEWQE